MATPRTGNPRGRPQGAKNKRTVAVAAATQAAAETIAAVIPGAFEGDAHALLMTVYKDPSLDWALRLDAAKKAVHFEKPALASVEQSVTGDMTQRVISGDPMTPTEWEQQYMPKGNGASGAGHD